MPYIKVLVDQDIQYGQMLLDLLKDQLPMMAAFWSYFEEANEWRLVIVLPGDFPHNHAYGIIENAIARNQIRIPLENISVLSPVRLRYKDVQRAAQGVPTGLTVARDLPGTSFAGDAYIYFMPDEARV